MKNTLKKATAALAAALMCAVPTVSSIAANAASSTNAYSFRTVYYIEAANYELDHIVYSWGLNSNGTSTPTSTQWAWASGNLYPGGSGTQNYHMGGGNFYPTYSTITGILFTQHCYSNYNTLPTSNFNIYSYKANGNTIDGLVKTKGPFLVGDINNDKKIDNADYLIVKDAANSWLSNYNVHSFVTTALGRYAAYKLDINNDGVINYADKNLLQGYINGTANFTK